ncbi:telomere repeat-binding protein 4-like [Bidens hawaiensis]|uniref:telomere repeat-binding protein 4-like n=1 Tax=Bidens hawaiensis TaxID=980011 RepID=UPI00404A1153
MVSKKRLYNGGFDGFVAPVIPKAPRSLRRVSHKKSSTNSEICPFELLAAVAGKLLQESTSSVSSTGPESKEQITIPEKDVNQEALEVKVNPLKLDYLDQGCCGESEFVPEPSNLELKLAPPVKDLPHSDNDSALEHASVISTNDKNGTNGDLFDANMEIKVETNAVEKPSEDFTAVKSCNNVKIGIRDDEENYFSFNQHIAKMRAHRLQSRAGYRRMRKMLNTTRHWKSFPKLKDYEPSNTTSRGVKPFDQNRKNIYVRERCQVQTYSKRRKLFHHNSKLDYVHETSSESISNIPKAKSVTSSVINHKSSHESKDGHLKFSINSFQVPELYIEMPETSTIGSLKSAVVEAVTAILGGELHVGVLLQGKKIKDDNTTLQQTGISLNANTLGFILEPNVPQTPQNEPCDNHEPPPPLSSPISPASPIVDVDTLEVTCVDNRIEDNQESQKESTEDIVDTKAIVPIRQVNPEALAMVPLNHKVSKRSELSQRRTRRPFSVNEVEALVEAVETLGTGRWRDVKIRSFDDANHRTYVDLKDKWKTLVHTASISPQQRRGEPVPQGLLDRVLAAHSFWSQNQSKPHGKHQTEPIQVQTPQAIKV